MCQTVLIFPNTYILLTKTFWSRDIKTFCIRTSPKLFNIFFNKYFEIKCPKIR